MKREPLTSTDGIEVERGGPSTTTVCVEDIPLCRTGGGGGQTTGGTLSGLSGTGAAVGQPRYE